jgi:F-type H+-transporting ATPase subunit epsilon
MSLQVCIMAPDGVFWNEEVTEIILPTNTGQIGILSNHTPLITALDIGVMLVRFQGSWTNIVLMGGFALINNNKVTILVNEAEFTTNVDTDKAQEELMQAEAAFNEAETQTEKIKSNLAFKRARARYQAKKSKLT